LVESEVNDGKEANWELKSGEALSSSQFLPSEETAAED
jgi:hypothetical protein